MATKATTSNITMDDLLAEADVEVLQAGDVIEAKVITATKNEVWLDLGNFGSGLVGRRELNHAMDMNPGDVVSASVIDPESDMGFAVLSLKKVAKEKGWDSLEEIFKNKETIEIRPYDANRGGLLIELEGIRGFLPVSQLTAEHYPRVANADKEEILQRLSELAKTTLRVRILDLNREENKLIVSEKEAQKEETKKRLQALEVGQIVEGVVTGTVDFGIFVNVEGIEGLIHISEISWDRVNNPADYVKSGEKVKAKVIAIDEDKLSLSMKQLSEDPWMQDIKQFKEGDSVEGVITRITPFGAFIQITPAIEALVHVSELDSNGDEQTDPRELFKVGEKQTFTIIGIDVDMRKISLSMKKDAKERAGSKEAKAEKESGDKKEDA